MAAAPASQGPIDDRDVKHWTEKFNDVVARPSEHLHQKSPETASTWTNGFFGCFSPIDLCLITWCVPCVTFGKTHHLLHKSAKLEGYEPINTSCLLFFGTMCVGCHAIPSAIQRAEIRERYNLSGNCITDLALACCCGCCSLVQQEKEVSQRGELPGQQNTTGYVQQSEMSFPAPTPMPQ